MACLPAGITGTLWLPGRFSLQPLLGHRYKSGADEPLGKEGMSTALGQGREPRRQVGATVSKLGGTGHPSVYCAFQTSHQKTGRACPGRAGHVESGSSATGPGPGKCWGHAFCPRTKQCPPWPQSIYWEGEVCTKAEVTLSERGVRCPPAFLKADGEQRDPSWGSLSLQHWGGRLGPQERGGQSERGTGAHQPLSVQASTEPHQAVTR